MESAELPIGPGALDGVRIVELAQFVFVPASSAILSDHGAEVIKVEGPEGDPYRTLKIGDGRETGEVNFAMEQNNRNKKSVALNLKSKAGRAAFLKLIESADVFITSIRPDAIARLGLGPETLRAANPGLIYVRGNGLGFDGPQANRAGFDASCFWARGGFADTLSLGHSKIVRQRPAQGDHTAAISMAMGICMALFQRERTGEGALIDVSLLGTAMWVLSSDVTQAQNPAYDPTSIAAVEFRMPLTRAYRTSDGRWIQLMFLDPARYWQSLCEHIGRSELAGDPRFDSVDKRAENGRELAGILDEAFGSKTLAEWEEALEHFDAPWEPVQSVKDLLTDPQAEANGYTYPIKVREDLPVTVVAGPVSVNGSPLHAKPRRAPLLGEHTDEVLAGIGLSASEVADLRASGAAV